MSGNRQMTPATAKAFRRLIGGAFGTADVKVVSDVKDPVTGKPVMVPVRLSKETLFDLRTL